MTHIPRSRKWKGTSMYLAVAIGITLFVTSAEVSLARQKQSAVYNQCACLCDGPTGGTIIDISNTGGFSCGAYSNRTCNYEDPSTGGIRTGTTKYCGGFKPGGTKATMLAPSIGQNAPVMRRGVEGEDQPESGDVQERAIPRMRGPLSEVSPTCGCSGGTGTCTVTTTDTTATCSKGSGTCTGTCKFMPGTGTGFSGAPIMRRGIEGELPASSEKEGK